jgi:hypothetical protein
MYALVDWKRPMMYALPPGGLKLAYVALMSLVVVVGKMRLLRWLRYVLSYSFFKRYRVGATGIVWSRTK